MKGGVLSADSAPGTVHSEGTDGRPHRWTRFYPPGVHAEIDGLSARSLSDLVHQAAREYPDRVAFSNMGTGMTFSEVDALATRFAAFLRGELGLEAGDRIAIQMPNLLQYPIAMFGALRAGLVVVNVNPLYTVAEMEAVLADSRPKAIVVLANFADKVQRVSASVKIDHVIVTQIGDLFPWPKRIVVNTMVRRVKKLVPSYRISNEVRFVDALRRGARCPFAEPVIGPEDLAFLQYTGGTTGGVKAAMLTHHNLVSNQSQFGEFMRFALDGVTAPTVIAPLPLYHVFSLTVNCLGLFRLGATNILITDPGDTPGLIQILRKTKPHAIVLVNTLAAGLLNNADFATLDFARLKMTLAGGMALRSSVAAQWQRVTGSPILEGYGLTEASPVVSTNPPHLPPRTGTIGVPLPSTDVAILDDERQPVPIGTAGELAVKGPQVMRGYWNRPQESAEVLTADGWLLTGDIATIDGDGYLTIADRKKDMIVVSGFNVYPGEIEDTAMRHPKVLEAGVIGVPDDKSGEAPKLFVVKRDPSLTEDEIRNYLRERLTGYKQPRHIQFVEELPKTNVGKVLRRALHNL